MTGGSDVMLCMFLGGGKGDMADGYCLFGMRWHNGGKDHHHGVLVDLTSPFAVVSVSQKAVRSC